MDEKEWKLVYYSRRLWNISLLRQEWDGNGNTVIGILGNGIKQSFPRISIVQNIFVAGFLYIFAFYGFFRICK